MWRQVTNKEEYLYSIKNTRWYYLRPWEPASYETLDCTLSLMSFHLTFNWSRWGNGDWHHFIRKKLKTGECKHFAQTSWLRSELGFEPRPSLTPAHTTLSLPGTHQDSSSPGVTLLIHNGFDLLASGQLVCKVFSVGRVLRWGWTGALHSVTSHELLGDKYCLLPWFWSFLGALVISLWLRGKARELGLSHLTFVLPHRPLCLFTHSRQEEKAESGGRWALQLLILLWVGWARAQLDWLHHFLLTPLPSFPDG